MGPDGRSGAWYRWNQRFHWYFYRYVPDQRDRHHPCTDAVPEPIAQADSGTSSGSEPAPQRQLNERFAGRIFWRFYAASGSLAPVRAL